MYFCKMDLFKAYLHLRVDEESSVIQTKDDQGKILKSRQHLQNSTECCHKFYRGFEILFCESYFNDIFVHGTTKKESVQNLRLCSQRFLECDMHVNKKKYSFFAFFEKIIEYSGHIIEKIKS